MNNTSPLLPQGSLLEQKNKGRARVKIAVFFVLAIHGIGLMALLLQGCRKDEPVSKTDQGTTTAALPTLDTTNPPAPEPPTGATPGGATTAALPPVANTNDAAASTI